MNTDMTKGFGVPDEEKIQMEDIVNTVDYLLKLLPWAVVSSIDIKAKD